MQIIPSKRLFLPAFTIIAVVGMLLVFIGTSTYRNIDREKQKSMAFIHRQGVTLLKAIEAGARAQMLQDNWQVDSIARLIQEVAQNEDVAYIYVFDRTGRILHHSDGLKNNRFADWDPASIIQDSVNHRLVHKADNIRIYELVKRFTTIRRSVPSTTSSESISYRNGLKPHAHADDIIVLGLMLTALDAAQRADLYHALIMAAIVLALGTGTFFFLFVIQNYYLVDRALQQAQNYTQQVVTSMSDGMLSLDTYGHVVALNKAAVDMLGIRPDRLKGIDLQKILDFDGSGIKDALKHGRTTREREILYPKTKELSIPLGITTSPILEPDGSPQGAVLILRDLREIKRLEAKVRRSEKLAAVGKLAAGIAHEVRNPLSSIKGFAQFLRHALKDRPKEQEYAQIMVNEIDRINRVVTDLLSFANPRDAEPEPTDTSQLVSHIVKLVEMDAQAKQIDLRLDISPDLGKVNLDPTQITQAFLNLLINALKFVPKGGHIHVKAEQKTDEGTFIFQVEDDGPGILPDQMAKIFEPFYTTRETGTGLGLAIVHKILESHQGEIDVVSPPPGKEQGARFTVRIPIPPER